MVLFFFCLVWLSLFSSIFLPGMFSGLFLGEVLCQKKVCHRRISTLLPTSFLVHSQFTGLLGVTSLECCTNLAAENFTYSVIKHPWHSLTCGKIHRNETLLKSVKWTSPLISWFLKILICLNNLLELNFVFLFCFLCPLCVKSIWGPRIIKEFVTYRLVYQYFQRNSNFIFSTILTILHSSNVYSDIIFLSMLITSPLFKHVT